MTKPMLSRIPEDLHARVKAESNERGVSMTRIVIEALEKHLDAVHFSGEWVLDPRFSPDTGGLIVIKLLPGELNKIRRSVSGNEEDQDV